MTTLTQQLRNLAVPQTSGLVDLKKRASILFDPKEAATKDRKTIFDLGSQGLTELIALNHAFAQFEDTLFQHSALHLERSMEDSSFNRELDKNIRKFVFHLSPYFMLRSAHMCLEWLIRRFQVHEYNKDEFMCLILPYHETNIFVKCVQILRVKNPSDPWNWLQPIQKPGVTVPKSVIINRAKGDPSFLYFVCKNVIDATKELRTRASTLQCLINFYCSVVIGVFENCKQLKEWHITTILPSILKGMKSGTNDFTSASFMITSQLVSKTTVSEKLLNALVSQIWSVKSENLQTSLLLLLSWIAETQSQIFTKFPQKGFVEFVSNKWVTTTISGLSREDISMDNVVLAFIRTAIDIINLNGADAKACQLFLENLLHELQLSTCTAKIVIRLILEKISFGENTTKFKDGDVIDLESDSEMPPVENIQNWYSKIVCLLERQYPTELDEIVKDAMQSDDGDASANALKVALSFRYKFLDADTTSIFQNLYHANPSIRAISIKEIVNQINQSDTDAQHHTLLKETLSDRIKDDNEVVIEEILKLPTEIFVEILGYKYFVDNIIEILDKANIHPETWGHLQTAALTHLTSDIVVNKYDKHLILLSIMRYMLPAHNEEECAQYIKLILQSSFAESMPFLQRLTQKYKGDNLNTIDFKKDFLNAIVISDDTPHLETLIESICNNGNNYFKTAFHVSHFLLMGTACFKTNNEPEKTQHILNFTLKQCSRFKITQCSNSQWMSATKLNTIPMQLFMDFLLSAVRGTNFGNLLHWEPATKSLELFLDIFSFLTSKTFAAQSEPNEKLDWSKCLKDILNLLFPTPQQKQLFFSQFLLYENMGTIVNFAELRIRAIRFLELIFNVKCKISPDLRFILKVIVALGSSLATVRECSLGILRQIQSLVSDKETKNLTEQIIERSEEIQFDGEQVPLILYNILSNKKGVDKAGNRLLTKILNVIGDPAECIVFKSKILETIKHIKGTNILKVVIPIALDALDNINVEGCVSMLDKASTSVFKSVIKRIDENCIQEVITTDSNAWQLIEKSLKMPKIFTNHMNEKLIPVPCITLEIFDEATYNQMPNDYKMKFLKLIIETISLSDNDALFLDINKALRRCCLDCKHVLPLLECMNNVCKNTETQQKKRIAAKDTTDSNVITSRQWKEGVILLEILENKKSLQNTHVLIPTLFDILKKCLEMENQSQLEYTKQLILSALLQSCQRSSAVHLLQDKAKNTFRMDLIVQCIRVTQNPQTHYNALLLLSHCAVLFPQQVLHNLVDIFTFMGSSIARHDDAFSFQVISNIVESVIPILVKDKNSKSTAPEQDLVIPVLKIFSDILLDVPEHRRILLYSKLLHTLGAEQYFWLFLCVVFESHVINDEKNKLTGKKSEKISVTDASATEKLPKRIEITLQILQKFSTQTSLQTCISLMAYVKTLPMNADEMEDSTGKGLTSPDFELFDVKARSAKQLRHYKYLILQFVSTFTSSAEFLKAISAHDENEDKSTKYLYQNFIIKTLSFIPDVTKAIEKNLDTSQSKFWKVILHHCYDALDNVISLLSPDMFLVVVHGLMQHQLITIRKKVIELLISKLQQKDDYFGNSKEENILKVLRSLCETISTIPNDQQDIATPPALTTHYANETIFVQQAVLIAVKLLSKRFALKFIEQFKNIMVVLTAITKKRTRISKIILATVILTLVEVASNLKAHSISHLPKFMPHLVDALKHQATILKKQPPDNVCLALITGFQKLFEAVPLFLGPYIVGIITALSTIWSHIEMNNADQEQRTIMNINKLNLIWSKIAGEVPARVLIPHCEKAYYLLMEDGNYSSIHFIMKLLLACVSNSSNSDLSAVEIELSDFFLKSLEFRSQMSNLTNDEEIHKTELEIINAFVAWILKLSESSFRPIYKKVYDWAIRDNGPKERVLTYFVLNNCISNSLKSLFALFATQFIQDAAELLNACNTSKNEVLYFANSERLNIDLIKNILDTLTTMCVHGSKGFANPHRFDLLMQPIVDQLENNLVHNSDELEKILLPCVGQLAVAVSSDVLWKQLNYQILLKTRTNVPQTRIIAFNCCVELAKKLGDDFVSLLPETIPFVAELFEDENPQVVKNSRKAVQELETILGESLQKYL